MSPFARETLGQLEELLQRRDDTRTAVVAVARALAMYWRLSAETAVSGRLGDMLDHLARRVTEFEAAAGDYADFLDQIKH